MLLSCVILIALFILINTKEAAGAVVCTVTIFISLFWFLLLHLKTKIQFSPEKIKVTYGWLPIIRTRKAKDLINIYIDYGDTGGGNDSVGSGFKYLILEFSKGMNIQIIIDPLTRNEIEQLTSRLSTLRSKYGSQQFEV